MLKFHKSGSHYEEIRVPPYYFNNYDDYTVYMEYLKDNINICLSFRFCDDIMLNV